VNYQQLARRFATVRSPSSGTEAEAKPVIEELLTPSQRGRLRIGVSCREQRPIARLR